MTFVELFDRWIKRKQAAEKEAARKAEARKGGKHERD